MAIENITVDSTKRLGAELRQAVSLGRAFVDQLRKVKQIMDRHTDGVSYTELATQFGVPSVSGQATYNLTAGSLARIDHADTLAFLERLG